MRYGILGDIHANLEALEAVYEAGKAEKVETFLCVGDIVGYGASPGECIEILQAMKIISVAGNHDWTVAAKAPLEILTPLAREAVLWTREKLSLAHLAFLNRLPLVFKKEDWILVHGTLHNPGEFIYLKNFSQTAQSFALLNQRICFLGHTHVPRMYVQQERKIFDSEASDLAISPFSKYIINVGSVGQPRDGNPQAAFGVYDTDKQTAAIKRISYDVKKAQEKILKAGLPETLALRLAAGQ